MAKPNIATETRHDMSKKPASKPEEPQAPPAQLQSQPAAVPHTVSHMLGEITWLMTQSPVHKHFALADLEWMVMPPLLLQQYRVFRDAVQPVGVALWAFLSEEAEAKVKTGKGRLRPDEWKSGDRCWVTEVVAPFATAENQMVARMLTDLSQTALKGREFSFFGTEPGSTQKSIRTVSANLPIEN
jgi:cytolysin-activating lysine-acyltransferase